MNHCDFAAEESELFKQVECVFIVPCYNEQNRLPFDQFSTYLEGDCGSIGFLFVDDGSKDKTRLQLENFCARHKACALAPLDKNVGKAEAVRQGINLILRSTPAKFIGYLDADLATPLSELKYFVNSIERPETYSVIMGSRVKLLGHTIVRKTSRHCLGRVFAMCVSLILNLPVYDTQCGAKLFRVDKTFKRVFENPFLSRWIFDVEVIARYLIFRSSSFKSTEAGEPAKLQHTFFELPLHHWEDIAGSRLKFRDFVYATIEIVLIRFIYFSKHHKSSEDMNHTITQVHRLRKKR